MNASVLELVGMLAGSAGAGIALLGGSDRARGAGMALALVCAPLLIAGDVWDSERVVELRSSPAALAAGLLAAVAAVGVLVLALRRWPLAFAALLAAFAGLRVPLDLGGDTSNLLLPLYGLIAAAFVARLVDRDGRAERDRLHAAALAAPAARWCASALAAALVAYAALASYSLDVSNAIENLGFFLIPFAVLAGLILERRWGSRELGAGFAVLAGAATAFSLLALGQYVGRDLQLNEALEQSNQIHLYFRVNSVFFDPNVFGRFLALAVVAIAAWLAFADRERPARLDRRAAALVAVAVLCLLALTLSYSLTSFIALIAGLFTVAALRWRLRGALAGAAGLAATLAVFVALGGLPDSSFADRDVDTSGRTSLVSGGVELAEKRPLAGWGSGSFGRAFYEQIRPARTTVSHAEPVTVAAEQGAVGLIVYLALIGGSLAAVLLGAGRTTASAALAAAYVAILAHSMGYAGFLIDPVTWMLIALALAVRAAPTAPHPPPRPGGV